MGMASPGELVHALAEALGLPEPTLVVHDRNLASAGLRTKGGRGWAAAKVGARDAAHLLTAVLGSGQVKDSVAAVRRYGKARPQRQSSTKKLFKEIGIKELAALPSDHSFIDALEVLIQSAATGSLAQWLAAEAKGTRGRPIDVAPLIEVAALTPGTVGDIRIAGVKSGLTGSVRYTVPSPWDRRHTKHPPKAEIDAWEAQVKRHRVDTDLEQYRRITARTILRVAEALASEGKR